jgi:hypothetical protein
VEEKKMGFIQKVLKIMILLVLISGCSNIDIDNKNFPGSSSLGVCILQNANPVSIIHLTNQDIVSLDGSKFTILTPNKTEYEAVKVCASFNKDIFEQIRINRHTRNIPCFAPGTGMAVDKEEKYHGYKLRLKNGNAHNHFNTSRTKNGKKYRQIDISSIIYKDISNTERVSFGVVYVVIFIDLNNDKIIDGNEFELLTLKVF